ncbi:hypothetical protein CROQUDRAFT_40095, partial [Cronartium quercuum f. sp. fusiforme G11]
TQMEQHSFFKDCIGLVNGTFIPLASVPHKCTKDYWTQKAFYAYNVMLVCDINRRIIYYEMEWCGSAHDQHAFQSSQLFQHPTVFFLPGEYLLANSGYTCSEILVPTFKWL